MYGCLCVRLYVGRYRNYFIHQAKKSISTNGNVSNLKRIRRRFVYMLRSAICLTNVSKCVHILLCAILIQNLKSIAISGQRNGTLQSPSRLKTMCICLWFSFSIFLSLKSIQFCTLHSFLYFGICIIKAYIFLKLFTRTICNMDLTWSCIRFSVYKGFLSIILHILSSVCAFGKASPIHM